MPVFIPQGKESHMASDLPYSLILYTGGQIHSNALFLSGKVRKMILMGHAKSDFYIINHVKH